MCTSVQRARWSAKEDDSKVLLRKLSLSRYRRKRQNRVFNRVLYATKARTRATSPKNKPQAEPVLSPQEIMKREGAMQDPEFTKSVLDLLL
mmetsp:Transcript_13254/g.21594  ORF Transcript_13254/g.21594 Transcript_13254/m.21594 type:complete len:91 (-) Transcript_13254:338-610(-)|eukprot:CAMPEP_0203753502 /NCGR_PEP_ID=MMETSP0098-20131031/7266_1 /ASSEMBLY_ACC=CAM_ASM_000208 /TAXON_ID=96639 /ORGANISM=" , Strain NY0313808BC1" /LENGTH=90 /DNA_ID=CAMNT_0050644127 /DNA_START=196 /DNA_END=468 /DNA_ORIENTATION=+